MNSDLIYDFGLHRGEDTDYYLSKGFRVVAIEANPELITECKHKFRSEMESGRLYIIEGAIAPDSVGDTVTFYRNIRESSWGTIEPEWVNRNAALGFESDAIQLRRIDVSSLFMRFGVPHYVKIDIEGVDKLVLDAFIVLAATPQYVSIESEKVDFNELVKEFEMLERLGYKKFKIVQQENIPGTTLQTYTLAGRQLSYKFMDCASGPFGDDISKAWLTKSEAIAAYKNIFGMYRLFGDKSLYPKLPRIIKGAISTTYKTITGYRGPLPGWYDTHASL